MKRLIVVLLVLLMVLCVPSVTWDACDTDMNCCLLWDDCGGFEVR